MASSRIQLQSLPEYAYLEREIYIGWDHGAQTYFAQVFDGQDDNGENELAVNLGNFVGEITDPKVVIDAVRPYAEIPDDLNHTLAADRASDTSTEADLRAEAGHVGRQALQGDPEAISALLGFDTRYLADDLRTVDEEPFGLRY